jgi:hypothetical protein
VARCGCSGSTCSCLIVDGAGTSVSGTGTEGNPYVIDVSGSNIAGTLAVVDTATVDLTLDGSGSSADPYVLSADSAVAMTDLTDVTAGDTPATGDVPVWNGTSWDFAPPPTTPPGAVSVGDGLTGDGSGADPLEVAVSGTWGASPLNIFGTNTLLGAETYIDVNGQVRTRPYGVDVIASDNARPDQYPGRVYVRSDNQQMWWSDGTRYSPVVAYNPVVRNTRNTDDSIAPGQQGNVITATFDAAGPSLLGRAILITGTARLKQEVSSANLTIKAWLDGVEQTGSYPVGSIAVTGNDIVFPISTFGIAQTAHPRVQLVVTTSGGRLTLRAGSTVVGVALSQQVAI